MQLDGIHHISAITGDAPRNVDFYTRVLGMRMVKKTVNQDDPSVYHLFYGDDAGTPGFDMTFFEYPGARPGRPGEGVVHRVVWRVADEAALEFWRDRLLAEGAAAELHPAGATRGPDAGPDAYAGPTLVFADPEGLAHELVIDASGDEPLLASTPGAPWAVPAEHAIRGFAGARAYSSNPAASAAVLQDTYGFEPAGNDVWTMRGPTRGGFWAYDVPPVERGINGAGVVHHIAFASQTEEQQAWHDRIVAGGLWPSPVVDRFWFEAVYAREPSGVLFEVATLGPGFAIDESPDELGQKLVLPPTFEPYRDQIEAALTPLPPTRPRAAVDA